MTEATTHTYWYLSRSAGFTAYLLLSVSVMLGLVVHTRLADRWFRRANSYDLHRFVSILALAFTLLHVYVLLGDGYFEFTVRQLSVPFASPYRTLSVTVGVFGLYAFVVIVGSFYMRRFIGYRAWRAIHYLTFGLFVSAAVHGVFAGTDTAEPWARGVYLGSALLVFTALAYRVQYHLPETRLGAVARFASAAVVTGAASFVAFSVVLR